MPGSRDHLQLVGGRRFWVRPEPRMQVATQAIFAGPQDHRVFAMTPQATGRGYGHIAVRVGRVLVYLEDRDALQAWTTAIGKAADLADAAFGPDLPASGTSHPGTATSDGAGCAGSTKLSAQPPSLQQQQMTGPNLPLEGLRPWPGTSDQQFDSAGLTEAHRHWRCRGRILDQESRGHRR